MTSLEKQLKRLKTPQTEEFRQEKYRSSFLYDRKEAAAIDCDTHLRIAHKGLKKLIKIQPELEKFQDLFGEESKALDRSSMLSEENARLADRLRRLLNNTIVPFFMLNECHEVLEYLIYKYHVHSYQPNDLLCALLPYHETRLFARALQVIERHDAALWGWLEPYKKEGVPVPKERVLSVLASKSRLPLVALLGDKLIEINRDTNKGSIYTSFYTTTMMCVLDRDLDESFFVSFTPHVYKAIKKSNNLNLFMAGLVLIGYLAYTQDLDEAYLERIKLRLIKTHAKLRDREHKNQPLLDEYFTKVLTVIKSSSSPRVPGSLRD